MGRGERLKTIAIVGAGFSGTVLAASLLERSAEPVRVLLFDRTGTFGAGVAYGTEDPCHLLNVPASKMSAFEDRPGHFTDWLAQRGIDPGDGFVARSVYRRYLQSLLDRPPRNQSSELRKISDAVIAVEKDFQLSTANKGFFADVLVLAMGHLRETSFARQGPLSPFDPRAWPNADVENVVLIGSGLTSLDAAASVFARYPKAKVVCVSRHGFFPEPFILHAPAPILTSPPPTGSVRTTLRWLRQEISLSEANGGGWPSVFDAMRPQWETVWKSLSERERRRFTNHLLRYFDRFRHRVPPALHASLAPFRASGALSLRRGQIAEIASSEVRLGSGETLAADLVLDCSGFAQKLTQSSDAFIRNLLATHRIQPGPLGMGLVAEDDGRVCTRLFAVGPLLRGMRWETTAVPEIRRQIETICQRIYPGE